MIEVTNEMLSLLREYQMGAYGELDDDCDKRMIAALIELYEQDKPKPEPVGYALVRQGGDRDGQIYKAFNTEKDAEKHRELVIFPPNEFLDLCPLYTTPPTREPLRDEQISLMAHNDDEGDWNDLNYKKCWYKGYEEGFRRAEKAHGIGATK